MAHTTLAFYLCSFQVSPTFYFFGPHNFFLLSLDLMFRLFPSSLGRCEDLLLVFSSCDESL